MPAGRGRGSLETRHTTIDNVRHVQLSGELGYSDVPVGRAALTEALDGDEPVVIDLCAIEYIDSLGLSILVDAARRARERGRPIAMVCPTGYLRDKLDYTGLSATLHVCDDLDSALRQLVGSAG